MHLLAICMSSLKNVYVPSKLLFKSLFFLAIELSSLYILDINPLLDRCFQNFVPFFTLPFHFVDGFLWAQHFSPTYILIKSPGDMESC